MVFDTRKTQHVRKQPKFMRLLGLGVLIFAAVALFTPKGSASAIASGFNDKNFYKCVVDYYNMQNRTKYALTRALSDNQLKRLTNLTCIGWQITDLTGIEKLPNLTTLTIIGDPLTRADLSHNTKLREINLSKNNLSSVNLGNNTTLKKLNLANNNLRSLSLTRLTGLESLDVRNNRLSALTLTKNARLSYLVTVGNGLRSLDVRSNPALQNINIDTATSISMTTAQRKSAKLYRWKSLA